MLIIFFLFFIFSEPPGYVTHSGRQFFCVFCRKSYTKMNILRKHMNTTCYWNPESRIYNQRKQFSCTDCHASFSSLSLLTRHIKIDCGKLHTCTRCLSTFNHFNSLQKHKARCRQ